MGSGNVVVHTAYEISNVGLDVSNPDEPVYTVDGEPVSAEVWTRAWNTLSLGATFTIERQAAIVQQPWFRALFATGVPATT